MLVSGSVEYGYLAILGLMAAFVRPVLTFSAVLGSITIIFGPGVTLSVILRSVTTFLADLGGGVGTILAGGNIVIFFHSHRSGEHLTVLKFL